MSAKSAMNVFIIPSWYPSDAFPSAGIFFREQAVLTARHRPGWRIGISTWGSHEPELWLLARNPLRALIKWLKGPGMEPYEKTIASNCVAFFSPAFTWTRRVRKGNIRGIVRENRRNLDRFTARFGRPSVIHAHAAYPGGYVAQMLSKETGIPYVITEHMGPFPLPSFRRDWKKFILPPLKNVHKVLAVSQYLVDKLRENRVEAQKSSNFIDDQFFYPKHVEHELFTFISVARLEEVKGFPYLLEATHLLSQKGYSFRLKIVGTGSKEAALKEQAAKLRLESCIEWLGELPKEGVRDQLHRSDAFVLSSLHENQPVALLEALACGLQVVVTNCPGGQEMIGEDLGYVAEVANAPDLAKKMEQALLNKKDAVKIRENFEMRFGTERRVGELEEIYEEVSGM